MKSTIIKKIIILLPLYHFGFGKQNPRYKVRTFAARIKSKKCLVPRNKREFKTGIKKVPHVFI